MSTSCAIASPILPAKIFIKTVEEVSGKDLRWYFEQAVSGTQFLSTKSWMRTPSPLKWYEPEPHGAKTSEVLYRTYVTIQRKVDFVFPVDLKVTLTTGQSVTRALGRPRSMDSLCLRPKVSARLRRNRSRDSDLARPQFFNNSYTVNPTIGPPASSSNIWVLPASGSRNCSLGSSAVTALSRSRQFIGGIGNGRRNTEDVLLRCLARMGSPTRSLVDLCCQFVLAYIATSRNE